MTILRPDLVTPGYIFLGPYRNLAPGPYIYDNYGELVWSGAGASGSKVAHSPHVCQYKGRDHICYFQGEQHHGFARGYGVIMDSKYRVVKNIDSSGAGASSDMHEFRMTPHSHGTTVLMTVYQTRPYDLTVNPRFNLERGMGWINDGVFQEIDIDSGRVVFEWRSLDHVDPELSWTLPGTTDTSGTGLTPYTPWDYFHINSIDKNEHGDYLISARHASAIYKLSGRDGHIIWQLGGNKPSFDQLDFTFSYQHDARWVSENDTHTVLSLFDNASNAYNETDRFSHAVVAVIDHVANTARLMEKVGAPEPEGGLRSGSQGNVQRLADGACHIGWGEHARFSEHTADGSAVLYGKLALRESNVMVYRSHKFAWSGQPITKPALWTYSRAGPADNSMRFYVSWNGATEVRSWRFFTGPTSAGPFVEAGTARRTGFETEHEASAFAHWAYAEALDADARPLQRSVVQRTFVPSQGLVDFCDARGCDYNSDVPDDRLTHYDSPVATDQLHLSTNRGFNTTQYYAPPLAPPRSNGADGLAQAHPSIGSDPYSSDRWAQDDDDDDAYYDEDEYGTSAAAAAAAATAAAAARSHTLFAAVVLLALAVAVAWYCRSARLAALAALRRAGGDVLESLVALRSRVATRYARLAEKDDFEAGGVAAGSSSPMSSLRAFRE